MLQQLNDWIVQAMDYPLGWVLLLPRDLMLLTVAVMTSGVLVLARRLTTDQSWLRRAHQDRRRLAQLIRQARKARDKPAARRHKETVLLVKVRALKYELKPLLWALVPVALLATWAFSRIGYLPPRAGQSLEVRAYLPNAAIGQRIHIAPQPPLDAPEGWVRTVVKDSPAPAATAWDAANAWLTRRLGRTAPPEGVAVWRLVPSHPTDEPLRIRFAGRTYEKQFQAGRRTYAPPVEVYPDCPVQAVELAMEPVRLFGRVGGIDLLYLPAWLVAYLLIAIPFVSVLKRAFGVY